MSQALSTENRTGYNEDLDEQAPEQTEPSMIDWSETWKPMALIVGLFMLFFFLPIDSRRFTQGIIESLALAKWYAQEHVLLCLVPAFFIAGAISVFVSQAAVMKYLGAGAHKVISYGVASVSGSILAVCSCTVLPLFAGIWKRGAGLGPAVAFLYSGPAINVLAIILTAPAPRPELGAGRAVGGLAPQARHAPERRLADAAGAGHLGPQVSGRARRAAEAARRRGYEEVPSVAQRPRSSGARLGAVIDQDGVDRGGEDQRRARALRLRVRVQPLCAGRRVNGSAGPLLVGGEGGAL